MRGMLTTVAAVCAVLLSMPTSDAFEKYAVLVPNGKNVPGVINIGHLDPTGSTGSNDFGKAFNRMGKTWNKAFCEADSDGDGFTNGQELGDPCCTWTQASPGTLVTDGVSHPGDKTKTPANPTLQAKCGAGGAAAGGGAAGNGSAAGGGATIGGAATVPVPGGMGGGAPPGTVHTPPTDTQEDYESFTIKPMSSALRSAVLAPTAAAAVVVSLVAALLL